MASYDEMNAGGRNRSYTWHGQQNGATVAGRTHPLDDSVSSSTKLVSGAKKPWSRRNAWGDMSYADLISRAIESSPDRRMTLAQIYDWMVQNVPYFHDKGNTNSSAGWKNSIRHNLSLHRRFRRVLNDDSGKSSWWMLNDGTASAPSNGRRRLQSVGSSSHVKHEKIDVKPSTDGAKSPSNVKPTTNHLELAIHSPVANYDVISQQFSGPTTASMTSFKADQSSSILVTSDLTGESVSGHVDQMTPLAWIPYGTDQLSSVGGAVDSDGGSSTYPLPLLPISEIFDPVEPSASCDVQLVELQSPPVYNDYQFQTSSNQCLAPASVVVVSQPTTGATNWTTSVSSSLQSLNTNVHVSDEGRRHEAAIASQQQQQPGWSLLRQMLVQTHHENALMHGISDVSRIADSWNWIQSDSELTQADLSRHNQIDIAMLRSTLSSVDGGVIGVGADEPCDLLPGFAVVVEPLDENPTLKVDPGFTCRPEDFKYGDAWNVNLNAILSAQDETVSNNNNLKLCEVNFTGES